MGDGVGDDTAGRRVMDPAGCLGHCESLTLTLRSHCKGVMCQITHCYMTSLASLSKSFHKDTRAEAGGIVRILMLDSWSEEIVAWFTESRGNGEKRLDSGSILKVVLTTVHEIQECSKREREYSKLIPELLSKQLGKCNCRQLRWEKLRV